MECKFHVGQKVVCVYSYDSADILVEGKIYTVTEIFDATGEIFLMLAEAQQPFVSTSHGKVGWYHWRFRPLQETKTDISVFKKLLSPSNVKRKKQLEDA